MGEGQIPSHFDHEDDSIGVFIGLAYAILALVMVGALIAAIVVAVQG